VTVDRGSLRIAVISGDDAHHRYLVWLLVERGFDVALWLVEPASRKRRRALRQRRLVDWAAATYHHCRRRLFGLDAYRRGAFELPRPSLDISPLRVDSVEGSSDRRELTAATPDVTVVIGCGILQAETLVLCGDQVINVHGGHLPEYRGNHCVFFALVGGDDEKIGATLHHVDVGIDTGDIVEVIAVRVDPLDSAETLYCRAEHAAFQRLCAHLDAVAAGSELRRQPQPKGGRTFRMRDRTPWHDLRHFSRWRLRGGASVEAGSLQ
jgi:Formyl transferase